mmetsp:Transcript_14272/g.20929  ORF Transcript_14272/g.20929 Transcript_14272/m.20929 type:complete len:118 (-) Transcript_14272:850-1203(-)
MALNILVGHVMDHGVDDYSNPTSEDYQVLGGGAERSKTTKCSTPMALHFFVRQVTLHRAHEPLYSPSGYNSLSVAAYKLGKHFTCTMLDRSIIHMLQHRCNYLFDATSSCNGFLVAP